MERVAWTDDDHRECFDAIDRRLDRLETEIAELRRENMRAQFTGIQATANRIGGGLLVGLSGVIVAVLVQGG